MATETEKPAREQQAREHDGTTPAGSEYVHDGRCQCIVGIIVHGDRGGKMFLVVCRGGMLGNEVIPILGVGTWALCNGLCLGRGERVGFFIIYLFR